MDLESSVQSSVLIKVRGKKQKVMFGKENSPLNSHLEVVVLFFFLNYETNT